MAQKIWKLIEEHKIQLNYTFHSKWLQPFFFCKEEKCHFHDFHTSIGHTQAYTQFLLYFPKL